MTANVKRKTRSRSRKAVSQSTSFDVAVRRAADEMRRELEQARVEEQRKLDEERGNWFRRWVKNAHA